MSTLAVSLIFAVAVGGGFGEARATASPLDVDNIEIELDLALRGADGPAIVHLMLPGEGELVRSMNQSSENRWTALIEVRRGDWQVVFEAAGSGELSAPLSLSALGVDPGLLAPATTPVPEVKAGDAHPPWGWLSLASGTAGLAVLAVLAALRSTGRRHLRRGPRG